MIAQPTTLIIEGVPMTEDERRIIHSSLYAQVDDVHAGGVYCWGEHEYSVAEQVLSTLTNTPLGETPSGYGPTLTTRVITISLLVQIHDLDHPDMSDEEWAEAERLLSLLSQEFGR